MRSLVAVLRRVHEEEAGLTGTEVGSLLIASITVASLLAVTLMDAGHFSAEQVRQVILSNLEKVTGTLEVRGAVLVTASGGTPTAITFNLAFAAGGHPLSVDLGNSSALVINYLDSDGRVTAVPYLVNWLARGDADTLLEAGELVEITIALPVGSTAPCPCNLSANEQFTLEVLSSVGAVVFITRSMPAVIEPVMNLY